jgi:hypothetical protein
METYFSNYSPSEIRESVLQTGHPFGLVSKGEITETEFLFTSKEIPPGVIKGTLECLPEGSQYKTKISISVDDVDYEKTSAILILVFGYIFIAIIFIVMVVNYPANVWVYIIALAACFLLPPLVKLYRFLESSQPMTELAKEEFLARIKAVKSEW